jgi:hypothetical protein
MMGFHTESQHPPSPLLIPVKTAKINKNAADIIINAFDAVYLVRSFDRFFLALQIETATKLTPICEILDSYSGTSLLAYDVASIVTSLPTFRNSLLPPSSGSSV